MERHFIIRAMTRSEADFAIELARREGWNPGLSDAGSFCQADPGGFFIGLLDKQPIGCISAVSYEGAFGFIGFYLVVPEYRGQGYGIRLWQAAMKRLEDHNIGLDGVLAQEANYIRSGFRRAYRNIRFEGISSGLPGPETPEIVPLREVSFEEVAAYDRQCFPAERDRFLRGWLTAPSSVALGYADRRTLRGYGVMRRCYQGYKIGPLFADNGDTAERLYIQLLADAEKGEAVYLDIPESNPGAIALVRKHGMREVFATTRMYTGGEPDIALRKIFGVTSFELG
ncbi:MAG: GNAT family N-acetyltransferase [Chloroflexi bacterium]|nr:GNAT family N-acetyltransferase [Chloroflexota bacterium]